MRLESLLALTVVSLSACGGGITSSEYHMAPTPPTQDVPTTPTTPADPTAPTTPTTPPSNPTPTDPTNPTSPAAPPGGLYVGYYLEDSTNNPEDPVPGSYYLQLPQTNSSFSGEMAFTYIGCQSSNIGTVSGTKTDNTLTGSWTGTVDGHPVGGPYSGTYNPTTLSYSGTYSNSAGKLPVRIPNCIDYDVAALGTWEMFPVNSNQPSSFTLKTSNGSLSWTDLPSTSLWLVSVYDLANLKTKTNAISYQLLVDATPGTSDQTLPLSQLNMSTAHSYVIAITAFDSKNKRLGNSSISYIPPTP